MLESKYSAKEIFEELPIGSSLTELALPAIAGQLITLIYNIADTFFIGRVNNPLMITATSLSFPIFALSIPIAIVSGTGGGTLVSRLLGVHDEEEAKKVACMSSYLSLTMGLIFVLLVGFFMRPLLVFLGASEAAYEYTRQYMFTVVVLGGVPTIFQSTMANLLRGVGHSKEAGFGVSMGGILNIILDPVLMFMVLPSGMEVVGAGLATMFSNIVTSIYFIFVILKLKDTTPLGFKPAVGLPKASNIKSIFIVGFSAATMTLLFDINNLTLNKLMSAYGDKAVAAIGMTIKIERFALNICVGLCMGMVPLVAYNYAAKRYDRMFECVKITRRRGLIASIISTVMYELLAAPFNRIFIADAETVALGAAFLRRRALASAVMFLSFYMVHFFQGVGSGKHTLWLSLARYLGLCMPAMFILNHFFGMYGLALAQLAGDSVNDILSAVVFGIYVKKLKAKTSG